MRQDIVDQSPIGSAPQYLCVFRRIDILDRQPVIIDQQAVWIFRMNMPLLLRIHLIEKPTTCAHWAIVVTVGSAFNWVLFVEMEVWDELFSG
jgi:hypothetical protein